MKQLIFGLFTLALISFGAQSVTAQTSSAHQESWKEMENFHQVMSASFHPTEENNFGPLRENSALLVKRAKEWKKSVVPAGYKPEQTADVLKRLVSECRKVDQMVRKGKPDAQLTTAINSAHDVFHEILECKE